MSNRTEGHAASAELRGACFCGAVAFAVAPPYRWFAHCHCSLCRKQYGSLFSTGVGVERAAFRWLAGEAAIVHYRASAAFERPFCGRCGSALPAVSQEDRYWNVPAALLEGELDARPRAHIFFGSRSPLTEIDDALPKHDDYPPGFDQPTVAAPRVRHGAAAIAGSCLCGAVTFATSATPPRVLHCYCMSCRRTGAAAFSSTLFVPRATFVWTSGAERVRTSAVEAPPHSATSFCGECGGKVAGFQTDRLAALPAGAIDTPLPPLPAVHVNVGSKAPWYDITASGARFDGAPPADLLAELVG